MKTPTVLFIFCLLNPATTWADSSWAVLRQTAIQTAEHAKRLKEAIRTVEYLKEQVQDTQHLLELARRSAQGVEGLEFVSDFRNLVLETNDLIGEIKEYVDNDKDLSEEWVGVFGTLEDWLEEAGDFFESIEMSDAVNSRGYSIADSYQEKYKENSEYAQQLAAHAKTVNEKGALKQIAEEMAHLIQMENQVVYLLSEMLRGQSVEFSNENLKRKEEVIRFEHENAGIRRFMSLAGNNDFEI